MTNHSTTERLANAGIGDKLLARVKRGDVVVRRVRKPGEVLGLQAEALFWVAADRDTVIRKLTNYPLYPEIFPEVEDCLQLEKGPSYYFVDMTIKIFAYWPAYRYVFKSYITDHSLEWMLMDGDLRSLKGAFEIYEMEEGSVIAYYNNVVPKGLLGLIPSWIVDRLLSVSLPDVCKRVRHYVE